MPLITVKTVGEKTTEQKRKVAKDITETIVKNFKVPPEVVMIDIVEYGKDNFAVAGQLITDR
jgi:4-oxalocrotonate tautomerase